MWVPKAHLQYDFFSLSTVAEVFGNELADLVGFPFEYKYQNLDVLYNQSDIDKHAEDLLAHPEKIATQIIFIKEQIEALIAVSATCGPQESVESFETWYEAYRTFLPALGVVFGLEVALEKRIREFLSEDDFHAIAFADETATALEQRALLTLATDADDDAIQKHLDTYAWIGNKMMAYNPFTKEQVVERIQANKERAPELLSELQENREELEHGLEKVLQGLNEERKSVVNQYREILFLRTRRAEAVCQAAQLVHPLFMWIATKLGYTYDELLRFSKKEISHMLESGEHLDVEGREEYSAEFINDTFNVEWGSWGEVGPEITNSDVVQGTIACKGFAAGVVKIVNEVSDLEKIEVGDVIVAPYTNPNMVMAMEKAAAIVTNIGGMTSHAAIVSRELKKPCIIGTQNATQVFKDGDKVEVDADKGVVKILNS